jgi:hypothetical protein
MCTTAVAGSQSNGRQKGTGLRTHFDFAGIVLGEGLALPGELLVALEEGLAELCGEDEVALALLKELAGFLGPVLVAGAPALQARYHVLEGVGLVAALGFARQHRAAGAGRLPGFGRRRYLPGRHVGATACRAQFAAIGAQRRGPSSPGTDTMGEDLVETSFRVAESVGQK